MYTVAWTDDALDDLTRHWMSATSEVRQEINDAMALLDRHLRANGPRLGESRAKGRRVLHVDPVAVLFQVSERDRLVTVIQAWTF